MTALPAPAGRQSTGRLSLLALALAAIALGAAPAAAADPDALWKIVHDQCLPAEQQRPNTSHCVEINLAGGVERGHVVLKDLIGETQYLVIPTARVTGIEDSALLAAKAPNYWAPSWLARFYVAARAHRELPRDAIGLAINSASGRSQNQLHIHVDCVRPDLRQYLARRAPRMQERWADLGEAVDGHRYLAMRLDSRDLTEIDPFAVLARIPAARARMGNWSLVAVGMPRGFVLLAGHVNAATNDRGSGEELLDHTCTLAKTMM